MLKRILLLFVIALNLGAQAQIQYVKLYNDDLTCAGGRYEIPTINYDENSVVISADTLIYNVTVVIKDKCGNVIYSCVTTVNSAGIQVNIPQVYNNDKYAIELYYDDKYLYGFFENKQ